MKSQLAQIFDEILREINQNPQLKERITRILKQDEGRSDPSESIRRRRNRRELGLIDPYLEYASGEAQLRQKLDPLTVDQLKDIVSEHALDSSRLALKWKSRERLIELIVSTVSGRIQKGDAFRDKGKDSA